MNIKTLLNKAKSKYDKYQSESKQREENKLEHIKSETAREKVKLQYARDRTKAKTELLEAQTELKKAELKRKKIEKQLKETGSSNSMLGSLGKYLFSDTPKKRKSTKRRSK
jgi:hypothetical protein